MICHGFKGGIGTSSRVVGGSVGDASGEAASDTGGNTGGEATGNPGGAVTGDTARYTVGVLVQANHGSRRRLVIDGFPVGRHLDESVGPAAGR